MAGGNIKALIIAGLIGMAVMSGLATWLMDMGTQYSFTSNYEELEALGIESTIAGNLTQEVYDAEATTNETAPDPTQAVETPWSGAWTAIPNLMNAPGALITMVASMLNLEGVGAGGVGWFVIVISIILILIGVFAIIYALVGRTP